MYYSYTFNDGPTFEIHPESSGFWGIYGNGQHIITTPKAHTCIQMVVQMNAVTPDLPEELKEYGEHLPFLAQWETIKD